MVVSLLSHSLCIRAGGGQTPQWVWALKRDSLSAIYRHLSLPSYVACTPRFFPLFSVLATFFFLAFSSPLYLFFYPRSIVDLHFSLSLKQFPSHLFSPPRSVLTSLPPSSPPSLRLADSVLPWCLDHVGHERLLNIHHFRMSRKTNVILDRVHHYSLQCQSSHTRTG